MSSSKTTPQGNGRKVKGLTAEQIEQINEVLASLGDYGEIHLIIQRGELKYINRLESYKAWDEHDGKNT